MEVIYGINSIKALLLKQEGGWEKIIIASGRGGSSVKEIIEIARQKIIPVEFYQRKYLDELAGTRHLDRPALWKQRKMIRKEPSALMRL